MPTIGRSFEWNFIFSTPIALPNSPDPFTCSTRNGVRALFMLKIL